MAATLEHLPAGTGRPGKRAAILQAAGALFLAEGYAGVSMDAVAQRAGVSKATLYAHMPGKDALFAAVIAAKCAAMAEGAAVLAGHAHSLREGLARFGEAALRFLTAPETLAIYRIVLAEAPRAPALAAAFYEAGPAQARRVLAAWLAEEQRLGRLDPALDVAGAAADFAALLRGDLWLRAGLGLDEPDRAAVRRQAEDAAALFCRAHGRVQGATETAAP